jgi:ABC-2 type transport system permease protein
VIRALFLRTVAANRIRLLACAVGLAVWGSALPVIYATFGKSLGGLIKNNPLLSQFSQFGGGDLFSLSGAMAIGFIHPFTLLLMGLTAVGLPVLSIAGERQRGTLEVLLSRPISRRMLYFVLFAAGALFLGGLLALSLGVEVASAGIMGVLNEMNAGNVPMLWFNGWLLFVAFMSIGFAASVSFDRLAPALGVTLVILLAMYLVDVLASLWPDVRDLDRYTLFHYVQAKRILDGHSSLTDLAVLGVVSLLAMGFAWVVFPRRDLAAPI